MERVHQPLRAAQPDTHPLFGGLTARQHGIEISDARPFVTDDNFKGMRRTIVSNPELRPTAAGIFKGVTRQLGNSGGDARLVLLVEAQNLGEPAGSLADKHDVGLAFERDEEKTSVHDASRIATTVASSRPRR